MKSLGCKRIQRKLGAFVDGELPGAEMLPVAQHLEACAACADHVRDLRDVGELLRGASAMAPAHATDLDGLAAGVVTRIRAERAASWMAAFSHAVDDWHWFFVGAGSLAATLGSAMLVSSLILSGPKPEREDSLAALLSNLTEPAGTLFVVATPVGQDRDSMVMQFDNGRPSVKNREGATMPERFDTPTDNELVQALDLSLVTREGRFVDVRSMSAKDRRNADLIFEEIRRRLGAYEPARESTGLVVHRIELVANTSVTATAL